MAFLEKEMPFFVNNFLNQLLEKSEQLQHLINTDSQISKEENESSVDSNAYDFFNTNLP